MSYVPNDERYCPFGHDHRTRRGRLFCRLRQYRFGNELAKLRYLRVQGHWSWSNYWGGEDMPFLLEWMTRATYMDLFCGALRDARYRIQWPREIKQ